MFNSIPLPNIEYNYSAIFCYFEREKKEAKKKLTRLYRTLSARSNNSCQPFNSETSAILRDIIPIPYSENYFPKLASKLQTHHDRIILVPVS